jgi:hypothetical protein
MCIGNFGKMHSVTTCGVSLLPLVATVRSTSSESAIKSAWTPTSRCPSGGPTGDSRCSLPFVVAPSARRCRPTSTSRSCRRRTFVGSSGCDDRGTAISFVRKGETMLPFTRRNQLSSFRVRVLLVLIERGQFLSRLRSCSYATLTLRRRRGGL